MTAPADFGILVEPATLRIERLLPADIATVWSFLVRSDLRRKWLAAGEMELRAGAPFQLVWRNDELGDTPSVRPEGMAEEHSMASRILEVRPPRYLAFTWGEASEVRLALSPAGDGTLLSLEHHRLHEADRLGVSAGWHMHLEILAARVGGKPAPAFWEGWLALRVVYAARLEG